MFLSNINSISEREKLNHGKEWIEKLDKDLDDIEKDTSRLFNKRNNNLISINKFAFKTQLNV